MMSGNRPVYVPNRQRRRQQQQQQQRFHGAFTGGFSAGFFNTVGSQEGWKPREREYEEQAEDHDGQNNGLPSSSSSSRTRQRPQQRLEDFMDEHDHDTWGGPTSLKRDYQDPAATVAVSKSRSEEDSGGGIADWVQATTAIEPPANVGHRLLRLLGWREGRDTAYVSDSHQQPQSTELNGDNTLQLLSKKRLRRVQIQQQRVKLPPPKLDTCGLGFEPYQNAPEFRAYKERRQKVAQQRARLRGTTATSNVYRVANVIGKQGDDDDNNDDEYDEKDNPHPAKFPGPSRRKESSRYHDAAGGEEDDVYLSYETVEDFVGKKSVGGFALREDDDMAYDDDDGGEEDHPHSSGDFAKIGSGKVQVSKEHFNLEVYEHSSDEDDAARGQQLGFISSGKRNVRGEDFAGALSAFAGHDVTAASATAERNDKSVAGGGVTADGRPPLSGFVLGGATAGGSNGFQKRYPGPDVPIAFQVTGHEFGPDEHPLVLKALSRAVQLEAVDEKRQQAMDEALKANAAAISNARSRQSPWQSDNTTKGEAKPQRSSVPMAGGTFSGLAEAMKHRFMSVTEDPQPSAGSGGLRHPIAGTPNVAPATITNLANKNTEDSANNSSQPSTRQIKITRTIHKFVPHRLLCKRFHVPAPVAASACNEETGHLREEAYFQQEVLTAAAAKAATLSEGKGTAAAKANDRKTNKAFDFVSGDSGEQDRPVLEDDRPSMEMYKSIYEPESDLDESDCENDTNEDHRAEKLLQYSRTNDIMHLDNEQTQKKLTSNDKTMTVQLAVAAPSHTETATKTLVPYNGDRKRKKETKKEKKRSKSKRHRKEKRSSRQDEEVEEEDLRGSPSGPDGANGELDDKERRRRRRKKRYRKRSRSSSPTPSVSSNDNTDLSHDSSSSRGDRKGKRHKEKKRQRKSHAS